jgi:hypothetical protein
MPHLTCPLHRGKSLLSHGRSRADKPNLIGTWKMNPAKSDLGSNAIKSSGGHHRTQRPTTENHDDTGR